MVHRHCGPCWQWSADISWKSTRLHGKHWGEKRLERLLRNLWLKVGRALSTLRLGVSEFSWRCQCEGNLVCATCWCLVNTKSRTNDAKVSSLDLSLLLHDLQPRRSAFCFAGGAWSHVFVQTMDTMEAASSLIPGIRRRWLVLWYWLYLDIFRII